MDAQIERFLNSGCKDVDSKIQALAGGGIVKSIPNVSKAGLTAKKDGGKVDRPCKAGGGATGVGAEEPAPTPNTGSIQVNTNPQTAEDETQALPYKKGGKAKDMKKR